MLGKAHMAIGAACGLFVSSSLSLDLSVVGISTLVAGVAAGLPDVLDSENAAGREPLGVSWSGIKRDAARKKKGLIEILLLIPRVVGALIVDGIARLLPHRGLTHWLITWLLLSAIAFEIALLSDWSNGIHIALMFAVGYLSHLVADAFTHSGVALFAPLVNQPVHLLPKPLRFRYDSPVQWFAVLVVWGVALYALYPRMVELEVFRW